jgi:ABC-2 type transport system ATP-binding protein
MWEIVRGLKKEGVTIILTTHYIDEAEEIADRVGVINNGEIILIEDKDKLMAKLGKKQLILDLCDQLSAVPESLTDYEIELSENGLELVYTFNTQEDRTGITALMDDLKLAGIAFRDLNTTQSSLEDIFVNLVEESS